MKIYKAVLEFWNTHVATIVFVVMLLVFIGSSAFFALKLRRGIVPDEPQHFSLSKQFSTTWGVPGYIPEYGPLEHRPVLYYWINGRALNVLNYFMALPGDWGMLVALRFLNLFYSTLTVVFCYLLAKELIEGLWWQLLVVFLLTNTLMFVFLSGGVNYDNLTNLCSFAGIYFLIRVLNNKPFYANSLGWLICIGVGALVKVTILPLAVIMTLVWGLYTVKNRGRVDFHPRLDWKVACLSMILFAMVALNFSIYGVNILKYKTLLPTCSQILSEEECVYDKNVIVGQKILLPEKLSYLDVVRQGFPDPVEWFLDYWISRMSKTIFGIFGHKEYFPDLIITFYRVLMIWMTLIIVRYWKRPSLAIGSLFAVVVFYTLVLLRTNYGSELVTGFKHAAIQGRYIFPVIGAGYVLAVYFLSKFPNTMMRRLTICSTVFVFMWGSWVSPLAAIFVHPNALDLLPEKHIPAEQLIGEISGRIEVTQDFQSQCRGKIEDIELKFGTYQRTNSYPVIFQLIEINKDQVIAEQTISADSIKDNKWRSFTIPAQVNSLDDFYRISITSPQSVPGNAVTIWSSASDVYPAGQALVNGMPTATDLSFRYRCLQPRPAFATYWFQ